MHVSGIEHTRKLAVSYISVLNNISHVGVEGDEAPPLQEG